MARTLSPEQLLAELDELLRTMPPLMSFGRNSSDAAIDWMARLQALMQLIGPSRAKRALTTVDNLRSYYEGLVEIGYKDALLQIHTERHSLRFEAGFSSTAVNAGRVFDYFDELRKVVESAKSDILFVDP